MIGAYLQEPNYPLATDSTRVVAYINKERGMKSGSLGALLWVLLSWCNLRNIIIQARHIPDQLNMIADKPYHHNYSQRMVSPIGDIQSDLPKVANTPCQSVRHQVQWKITPVHVSSSRQGSLSSGHSEPIMGGPGHLCLPSNSSDSQCNKTIFSATTVRE